MRYFLRPFRWLFKATRILVFLVYLVVFIASHTISAISSMVSLTIETVTGVTTVAAELASSLEITRSQEKVSKKKIADLEIEKKKLSLEKDDLRVKNGSLGKEIDGLKKKGPSDVKWKGKMVPFKDAVADVTGGVKRRTQKVAISNSASIFGEGVPVYGVAILVATLGYELKTACDTMKDMDELQILLDPDTPLSDESDKVCGMKPPTTEEVWEIIKSSPENAWAASVSAYEGALEAIPTWEETQASSVAAWDWTKSTFSDAGAMIADGAAATGDWAYETGSVAVEGAGNLWNSLCLVNCD